MTHVSHALVYSFVDSPDSNRHCVYLCGYNLQVYCGETRDSSVLSAWIWRFDSLGVLDPLSSP
jgi:hypothetical protein